MQSKKAPVWCAVPALAVMLSACGPEPEQAPPQPPTPVEAIVVTASGHSNIAEFTGRIQAVRSAEVRARSDGIVLRRLYAEGTDVAAGTPLFTIDPRDYQAQAEQARAALARATAARDNAAQVVKRYTPLIAERAISEQELDQAKATFRQEEANVADARAALSRATLSLGYTTIRAPIAGRVGRAQVTEGALVSGAGATLMTTVEQMSPAYVVFTISNPDVANALDQVRAGSLVLPEKMEARIVLQNGSEYPIPGTVDFAAQSVDVATGTQTFRAVVPNPDRRLLPGQFVQVRLNVGTNPKGIVVPTRAVRVAGEEASVTVVGADNKAVVRPVQIGQQTGRDWVIESGLRAGERVIVNGWQKVQPGQQVAAKLIKPATGSTAR